MRTLIGIGLAFLLGCGGGSSSLPQVASPPSTPPMLRADFEKLVKGKQASDVLKAVGKPDLTQEIGANVSWYYHNRTKDPITGKLDSQTQVRFERGIVTEVNY